MISRYNHIIFEKTAPTRSIEEIGTIGRTIKGYVADLRYPKDKYSTYAYWARDKGYFECPSVAFGAYRLPFSDEAYSALDMGNALVLTGDRGGLFA